MKTPINKDFKVDKHIIDAALKSLQTTQLIENLFKGGAHSEMFSEASTNQAAFIEKQPQEAAEYRHEMKRHRKTVRSQVRRRKSHGRS